MHRTFCLLVPGTCWCQVRWWKKPSRSWKTPRGLGRTRRSGAAVAYRLPRISTSSGEWGGGRPPGRPRPVEEDAQPTVPRIAYAGLSLAHRRSWRRAAAFSAARFSLSLAFVRGEGGDVDQADDVVGIGGGVGDHRTAVGVADGENRAGDLVEQAGDVGGVDGDAAQWIGGGRNLNPFCLQTLNYVIPARSISKSAVHEDDGGPGSFLRVCAPRVASLVLAFSTVLRCPCSVDKNAAGISLAWSSGVSWSICLQGGEADLEDVA